MLLSRRLLSDTIEPTGELGSLKKSAMTIAAISTKKGIFECAGPETRE
jgi:hypothetical protein